MTKRTTAEWMKLFERDAVWFAPANEYEDVVKDPQVLHNQAFVTIDHPKAGEVKLLNHPVRYDGKPLPIRRLPPGLGAHSEEVLREIGYSDDDIRLLLESRVITSGKEEE